MVWESFFMKITGFSCLLIASRISMIDVRHGSISCPELIRSFRRFLKKKICNIFLKKLRVVFTNIFERNFPMSLQSKGLKWSWIAFSVIRLWSYLQGIKEHSKTSVFLEQFSALVLLVDLHFMFSEKVCHLFWPSSFDRKGSYKTAIVNISADQ